MSNAYMFRAIYQLHVQRQKGSY